jgi:O-antigen/teichoic acid export membrane protein
MSPPSPDPASQTRIGLKQRFLHAAKWSILSYAGAQLLRLGSNLILTRLLAPEYFGVMAVANVVIVGLWMFSDLGLGQMIMQSRRGDEPKFLNVVWSVNAARGVLITLLGLVVAVGLGTAARHGWLPSASVYADPMVPLVVAVISVYGIIFSLESTKVAWNRRHMRLAALTKNELACQVATTIFILTWASISPTVWALAFGWLFGGVLKMLMTHLVLPGPSNRFHWDRSAFDEVWNFGKWIFVSSSLSFLLASGDRVLLGLFLDSRLMGFYSIAFLLVNALQTAIGSLVGNAGLAAMSEIARERPHDLKQTLYRIRRPLDVVCLVSAGAALMLGEPIIDLLYDDRYAPVSWMLATLSLTLVATRLDVFNQCLVAMGRIKQLAVLNGARLFVLYTAVPVGFAVGSARGAIIAVATAALINSVVVLTTQARLQLMDARKELAAIPFFLAGLTAGWAIAESVRVLL